MGNYTSNLFMTQPIHLPLLAMAKPIKPNKSYNTPYMPRIQQIFFFWGMIQRFPLKETKQIQHSNKMNKNIWTLASLVQQG